MARLEDGRYELRVPYREGRELVMDVMRHGAGVQVVAPQDLVDELIEQLRLAARQYL